MTSVSGGAGPSAPSYEYTVGAPRVFVLPANAASANALHDGYAHSWSGLTATWKEETRLIPLSSSRSAGSMGVASFRLLRRTREDNGVLTTADRGKFSRGCYIAISVQAAGTFDPTKVQWWGWVTAIDAVRMASVDDEVGTVTAQELGGLMDSSQLSGWSQVSATQPDYPSTIGSPPSANISIADGLIVGNCVAITSGGAGTTYVFARTATDCAPATLAAGDSHVWTRWRLLSHLLAYCKRPNLPTLSVSIPAAVQTFLDDTSFPEVFELVGLTLKGALDLLLPRARGVGWYLRPKTDLTAWEVVVYSHDPDGLYLVAADGTKAINTPVNITADGSFAEVVTATSAADEFDEVVIRGERIIHATTVAVADGNLDAGWRGASATGGSGTASQQEDLYRKCTGVVYPSSPTTGDRIARNTEYRQGPSLDRVFTTFVLKGDSNGTIMAKSPPGEGSGVDKALVPLVSWDAVTKQISVYDVATSNQQPYLPTARLLRWLPWPKGVKPDGTDTRDAAAKAQPEYLTPRVFRYMTSAPSYDREKWINLLSHGQPQDTAHVQRGTPQVSADDRSLALRVEFSPPEILARGHWTSSDAAMAWSPLNPNDTSGSAQQAFDWRNLVLTVALESDQRVEVSKVNPSIPSSMVRRQLVINEPGLKCWTVQKGAVLGVSTVTGGAMSPDRVTATNSEAWSGATGRDAVYVTRCDYPIAQRMLDMVAAWVFRPRASATIRCKRPDAVRSWVAIGTMVGRIIERAANVATGVTEIATSANTVVESITHDWGQSPSVTVSTAIVDRPELPRFLRGGGGGSPSSGGGVSAQLGGTTPQAVAGLQADVARLERDTQKLPINPPHVLGGSTATLRTVRITGGNTLTTGQLGCKYSSSAITDVPSAYDPNVTSAFIDGICRGTLHLDGVAQSGFVLVHNDSTGAMNEALVANDVVVVGSPVTMTVGGDPNTTISSYPSLFF